MAIERVPPSPLSADEYRELRATIRERGTLRHLVALITFSVWAATMLWAASTSGVLVLELIPLLVLVAGFEIGFSLHVGVERIGRYLQVRYETESATLVAWERTAMELRVPSGGLDSLFLKVYLPAAFLNVLLGVWAAASAEMSLAPGFPVVELGLYLACHAAAVTRWLAASRFARSQRVRELAAFETLLRQ